MLSRAKCLDPCYQLSPCHASATCSVRNTVPFRTMVCSCRVGWVPIDDFSCKPVETAVAPECVRDDDCPPSESCYNRLCRAPCDCGKGADCFIEGHT